MGADAERTTATSPAPASEDVLLADGLAARTASSERLFVAEADRIARLCHRMAERFARGGRLLAFGGSPTARTDVCHLAVEFVHPVIVGKRALPAIGLTGQTAPVSREVELLVEPDDVAVALGDAGDADLAAGVALAAERGALTVAFAPLGASWELEVPTDDPLVAQELVEVAYHVAWELVHVFFEHRGLLEGRTAKPASDAGGAAFLYPFLAEQEHDLDAVLADVSRSVLAKAREADALRGRTVRDGRDALLGAAEALRRSFAAGGRVLAFGNGGSATDAADLVADLVAAGRPALDLSETSAIVTAIGNDIGPAAILARQVIAHARPADALVAYSTSGASESVLDGLAEARRRGLATVALVGYDGGRILRERLADHVVVSPSQHIPRIQEAQATASHLLLGLVGPASGP